MEINSQFEILKDAPKYDGVMEDIYSNCFGPGRFAKAAHILREGNQCLYEISRVVINKANGEIIGGCRMWPIEFEHGAKGIFLGPIAILGDYRKFGIGLQLVQRVLLANEDYQNLPVLLVGDFDFFSKSGFLHLPNNLIRLPMPAAAGRILWRPSKDAQNTPPEGFKGRVFAPQITNQI